MKILKINSKATNLPYAYILAPREKNLPELLQEFKQIYGLAEPPPPNQNYYGRLAQAQLTHLKLMPHHSPRLRAVPQDLCQIFVEWLLEKDNFRLANSEQMEDPVNTEECWFG